MDFKSGSDFALTTLMRRGTVRPGKTERGYSVKKSIPKTGGETPFATARKNPKAIFKDETLLKSLLSDGRFRSRFIRELEVESIAGNHPEELVQRYAEEEIFAGRHASYYQPFQSSLIW